MNKGEIRRVLPKRKPDATKPKIRYHPHSACHYTQILNIFRALVASAKSRIRCKPIQIVFGPGGPSLFLPIYPPKDASMSTNGFNMGARSGGRFPLTIAYTDFHS